MNVSIEIQKIQQDLELLQDENLINSIKSILSFAKNERLTNSFKTFSIEEYRNRALKSENDIKAGRFINVDDL